MKFKFAFALAVCVSGTYDFDDPDAAHTSQAIQFDNAGRKGDSRRAFEAASKYSPSTQTSVNLGVCYMRLASASPHLPHKVELYGLAHEAMSKGSHRARTHDDQTLFEENWGALMTNFQLEGVDVPARVVAAFEDEPDHRVCGQPQAPSLFGRSATDDLEPAAAAAAGAARLRPDLEHQRDVPLASPLPRVSLDQLEHDSRTRTYFERREPFILTGAMTGWGMLGEASESVQSAWAWLDRLAARFPTAVTDFYPYNMLSLSRQSPYLTRLPRAVRELAIVADRNQQLNGSAFRYEGRSETSGRYMHLQLTPAMWRQLEQARQLPPTQERHWQLDNDAWMEQCLSEDRLTQEYHLKTHWKIVLVGARGAGMFNHSDSLQTSSWHAHVTGRKWWYVCGELVDGTRRCFEDTLEAGEIFYYGRGWSHETQNLVTPTATITDTAVHASNFAAVADKLHAECAREALDFKFSGALCDALDGCYNTLHRLFKGGRDSPAPR